MTEAEWAEQVRDAGEAHLCIMRANKLLHDMQGRDAETDWSLEAMQLGDVRDTIGDWLDEVTADEDEETEDATEAGEVEA